MMTNNTKQLIQSKPFSTVMILAFCTLITACTTNPATGDRQFTALLPASSEASIGAQEHKKIEAEFGKFMTGPIANYVSQVGQKVAKNTEREDVTYRFYVIDTPMVNAFALPGGYIYVTRGLLTLANNEAEMAAVIGHEIAHVTARHAAERMSQGTLIGIGAAAIGIATGSSAAGQAANLGSNLYLSSYSRSQEREADNLGIRYLARAGYDPNAMTIFLESLGRNSDLDAKEAGRSGSGFNYFSTHPMTAERVQTTKAVSAEYPQSTKVNRITYLNKINGMTYGDSASEGFVRGNQFFHPEIGFTFSVPKGSDIKNGKTKVTATHPNGTAIIFDAVNDSSNMSVYDLLTQKILKNEATNAEKITVNGLNAATASLPGTVNGKRVNMRVVLIEWERNRYFRFQMAIPTNVNNAFVNELKKTTYSFRHLSASEKNAIKPKTLRVLVAPAGATISSMAAKMDVEKNKTERFLVLNGLNSNDKIIAGQPYKIVVD